MKQISTFPFLAILMFIAFLPFDIFAGKENMTYIVQMRKQPPANLDREIDIDCEGHRVPSRPIYCNISSTTGIDILAIDKNEIESYEIYDDNNICIFSFSTELDFIQALFSLNGSFEIRFITNEYILTGYISA